MLSETREKLQKNVFWGGNLAALVVFERLQRLDSFQSWHLFQTVVLNFVVVYPRAFSLLDAGGESNACCNTSIR